MLEVRKPFPALIPVLVYALYGSEPSTNKVWIRHLLQEAAILQTSKECVCLQLFQELATQMSSIHFHANLTIIWTSTLTTLDQGQRLELESLTSLQGLYSAVHWGKSCSMAASQSVPARLPSRPMCWSPPLPVAQGMGEAADSDPLPLLSPPYFLWKLPPLEICLQSRLVWTPPQLLRSTWARLKRIR